MLVEFPPVTHLAFAGLPWQGAHTVSRVLEHGSAVYLPTPQFVQVTHCVPVENVLPWQLPHTVSRVSEHGDAVYEPSPTQLAQFTHCDPVQNSLPLRHPPAARTLGLCHTAGDDFGGNVGLDSTPGSAASAQSRTCGEASDHASAAMRPHMPTRKKGGRARKSVQPVPDDAGRAASQLGTPARKTAASDVIAESSDDAASDAEAEASDDAPASGAKRSRRSVCDVRTPGRRAAPPAAKRGLLGSTSQAMPHLQHVGLVTALMRESLIFCSYMNGRATTYKFNT